MHETSNTSNTRRFRRRAVNLLMLSGACAAYIAYRYSTTGSTTALSWLFLIAILLGAIHYLWLLRR